MEKWIDVMIKIFKISGLVKILNLVILGEFSCKESLLKRDEMK